MQLIAALPDPSDNSRWVLVENQINAGNDQQFFHWVRQILTPAGVIRGSRIAVEYDPAYESLTMHWVRIRRGTNVIDRLDPARIQVGQRALDSSDFLVSAKKRATLLLDGVRVGDIIDYAYSIDGSNPLMNGMFTGQIPVRFEDPVEHLVARLFWPGTRKFYLQNHGTDIYPTTVTRSNTVEFTWNANSVPGLHLQPPTPAWYHPYPSVQLSEYQKWSDVGQWALKLFATNNVLSPELTKKIDEWLQLPGEEDRARAALQFVQDQIRNTSPESVTSGYVPTTPSLIFSRRFGDSKDKSWLLATILRALNIDASPVLVNTQARQTIADLHASPVVFNHAIVAATVNTRRYYLDPTTTYEKGPLSARSWPNYGFGLDVRPGITALSAIAPCTVLAKTTVSEYFSVSGFDQEAGVTINTAAEGTDAAALREHFATTPLDQIERDYLGIQDAYYPGIHSTAPLKFSDDEQNNRFQVVESYSIPNFWIRKPTDNYFHCHFYPFNVNYAMQRPETSPRTMPLAMDYPVHQVFHAEANWAVGWPVRPETQNIQNPAFAFYRSMSIIGTNLVMDFEYRSLADAVMPQAVPTYVRQMDAATKYLGCDVLAY